MYIIMCRHAFVGAYFLPNYSSQAQLAENLSKYLSFLISFIVEMLCTSSTINNDVQTSYMNGYPNFSLSYIHT